MRFIMVIFALSSVTVSVCPQGTAPPMTERMVQDTCRLVAWAFGYEQLAPHHEPLMRQQLASAWQSQDMETIAFVVQVPTLVQQLSTQPANVLEQQRPVYRQTFLDAAAQDLSSPFAQVVRELSVASLPPLSQQIVSDTCRLVAFAFGRDALGPQQTLLIRQELAGVWQSGDVQTIQVCAQIPQICQQIVAQPQTLEQARLQWRGIIIQTAVENPASPLGQVVTQLTGQPIQALAAAQGGASGLVMPSDPVAEGWQQEQMYQQWHQDDVQYEQQQQDLQYDQQAQDFSIDYSYDSSYDF